MNTSLELLNFANSGLKYAEDKKWKGTIEMLDFKRILCCPFKCMGISCSVEIRANLSAGKSAKELPNKCTKACDVFMSNRKRFWTKKQQKN